MIDIHTHILPNMDDGSVGADETRAMLRAMHSQGVTRIAATPHFYADSDDPLRFIARRDKAFDELGRATAGAVSNQEKKPADGVSSPANEPSEMTSSESIPIEIIPGAEVRYFTGCGRTKELDMLRIGDSGLLLLELPDTHFPMSIIDDLGALLERGIRPVIAHLNRCRVFDDDEFIEFCNEEGVLIQLNTECIIERHKRRRSMELIADRRVQFLGTDCHHAEIREPNKAAALKIIAGKLGEEFIKDFTETEEHILDGTPLHR